MKGKEIMGLFDKFRQNKQEEQEEQEYDSLIKAALEKYAPALHKVEWLYDMNFEISITQAYYLDLKFYFGYYNKEKPVKKYLWFYNQNQDLGHKFLLDTIIKENYELDNNFEIVKLPKNYDTIRNLEKVFRDDEDAIQALKKLTGDKYEFIIELFLKHNEDIIELSLEDAMLYFQSFLTIIRNAYSTNIDAFIFRWNIAKDCLSERWVNQFEFSLDKYSCFHWLIEAYKDQPINEFLKLIDMQKELCPQLDLLIDTYRRADDKKRNYKIKNLNKIIQQYLIIEVVVMFYFYILPVQSGNKNYDNLDNAIMRQVNENDAVRLVLREDYDDLHYQDAFLDRYTDYYDEKEKK